MENTLVGKECIREYSANIKQEEDGDMKFVFISNRNSGLRYDWENGGYYEEVLDPRGADTSSLKTFFKNHSRSVDSAVGKITKTEIENDELVGFVRFGTGEHEKTIERKYKEEIITDVSVGYVIEEYNREKREGTHDLVTVTKFRVFEVSAVGVGFDSGANKRSANEVSVKLAERLDKIEKLLKR